MEIFNKNEVFPCFDDFLKRIEVILFFCSVAVIQPNLVLKQMAFCIYSMLIKNKI